MNKKNALTYLHLLFGTLEEDIKGSVENQNISHFAPEVRKVSCKAEDQKMFVGRIWILSGTGTINFLLSGEVVHQINLSLQNFDEHLNIVCDEIDAAEMNAGLIEVSFLSFDLVELSKKNDNPLVNPFDPFFNNFPVIDDPNGEKTNTDDEAE